IKDAMFSEQSMGQTVAVEPSDGVISAPANGKIEMIFETGHAFGMRMPDGTGLLIHIGVDTVNLKGQGFTVLKKEGDNVKAGEPVVRVDLDVLRNAGYSPQTMIVITEPVEEGKPLTFIEFGKDVSRGDVISL
ncbi:MAG: PTS glucose transporter subunit IIA, partial [Synergistaceae bacterium]|nr:PTS glucose transporter subunit IIA [Synergistaceae bacterium]